MALSLSLACAFLPARSALAMDLPDAFVEYIESDGTQHIDLGNVLSADVNVAIDYEIMEANGYYNLFGCRTKFVFLTHDWLYVYGKRKVTTSYGQGRMKVVVDAVAQTMTINGNPQSLASHTGGEGSDTSATAYVFWAYSGETKKAKMRLYSCIISNGTSAVRALYPCRKGDRQGLYDVVTKKIFYNAVTPDVAFGYGPEVPTPPGLFDTLRIAGSPIEIASDDVTPAYGERNGLSVGEEVECSAKPAVTNAASTIAAACRGYAVTTSGVAYASGSATAFTYEHPDCPMGADLAWLWDVRYRATVVSAAGGAIAQAASDGWYDSGANALFTATPDEDRVLFCWTVDGVRTGHGQRVLSLPMHEPHTVSAIFSSAWYVAKTGTDADNELGDADHPFLTISNGIAHASSGDTVIVGDGLYEIDDELSVTTGILLKSENGAERTVVKRKATSATVARVLGIDHAEACVAGFALTGGKITVAESDTTAYANSGAGVRIGTSGGTLSGCLVTNNTQTAGNAYGVGVVLLSGDAVVMNCTVMNNTTSQTCFGSGVFTRGGTIVDSSILTNNCSANYSRGSVYLKGVTTMRRTKIVGNTAPNASYLSWGADWHATGGIIVETGGCLIENCLIADNVAAKGGNGGGISTPAASTVVNCTIAGNTAGYGGGVWSGSSASFINCIIQDNTALSDANPDMLGSDRATCSNCLSMTSFTAEKSSGNIEKTTDFKTGTYELKAGSPAIDAGTLDNQPWLATTLDHNRTNRLEYAGVDIGCYEYHANGVEVEIVATPNDAKVMKDARVTYVASVFPAQTGATYAWAVDGVAVSSEATYARTWSEVGDHTVTLVVTTGGKSYTKTLTLSVLAKTVYVVSAKLHPGHVPAAPYDTEANAFTSVVEAASHCLDGMTVRVYPGEYVETNQVSLVKGVRVESVEGPLKTSVWRANNTGRAFYLNHADAFVSGFAVTNVTWHARFADGIGFYVDSIGGTVSNCHVRNCSARSDMSIYGTGIRVARGTLVDCEITGNTNYLTINWGYQTCGGAGVEISNGRMIRCKVVSNRFECVGHPTTSSCCGGGIEAYSSRFLNCLIADNYCDGRGGGVRAGSNNIFTNCTIAGNYAVGDGGGSCDLYGTSDTPNTYVNTVISGNDGAGAGTNIAAEARSSYTYCFGPEEDLPAGEGNVFGTDPVLRNPAKGDWRPKLRSPLFGCGVYADWMATATDLNGAPRATDRHKVDIGACQARRGGMALIVR